MVVTEGKYLQSPCWPFSCLTSNSRCHWDKHYPSCRSPLDDEVETDLGRLFRLCIFGFMPLRPAPLSPSSPSHTSPQKFSSPDVASQTAAVAIRWSSMRPIIWLLVFHCVKARLLMMMSFSAFCILPLLLLNDVSQFLHSNLLCFIKQLIKFFPQ